MPASEESLRQVRVPLADIIGGGGSITIDDVADAAEGGDGAVTHFMQAPPREDMAPRVDNGDPAPMLGEDLRPIEGSRTATGLVDEAAANGTQPSEQIAPESPQTPVAPIEDPNQRGRRRMGIRPTTRFNEKYRYSNEDFYGPRGPDIYSSDVFGEKLYVPRAGELPMGLFASYAQQNQAQRAEIKKAIGDLLSSTKVSKTADPYQPAFTKLVTGWQNNFVAGLAEQYGGNKDLAWREIAQPGSAANKAYLDGMATMDALGQFVKFQWSDAQEYITQVMKGEINTTPEQKQRAYDVYYGIGNLKGDSAGGDFAKLLEETEALKRDMNTLKWIKERALPLADKAYSKLMREPVAETINGKRFVRFRTREEIMREIYPMMAQEGAQVTGTDPAYLEQELRRAIPEVKSDTYDLQSAERGGGGGGGGARKGAWVGTPERKASFIAEGDWANRGDATATARFVEAMPIGKFVDGREEPMGVHRFTNLPGKNPRFIEMEPIQIERDPNGDLWVSGLWVQEKTVTKKTATDGEEGVFDDKNKDGTVETTIEKTPYRVRVRDNGALLDRILSGTNWRGAFAVQKKEDAPQRRSATQQGATMTGAAGL